MFRFLMTGEKTPLVSCRYYLAKQSSNLRTITFIQGDTKDNAIAVRSGLWKLIESKNTENGKVHQLYDSID